MKIFQLILLAVIIALALYYLIRAIVKIAKGDSSCIFCSGNCITKTEIYEGKDKPSCPGCPLETEAEEAAKEDTKEDAKQE